MFLFSIILLFAAIGLFLILVASYLHHKKGATTELLLIGRQARVTTTLAPEGAVLLAGEMWRAVTYTGAHVAAGETVRVCGARGHLLIVEAVEKSG